MKFELLAALSAIGIISLARADRVPFARENAMRGATRHNSEKQCGYAYNHCCANNVPRTWMDMAEGTVTADRTGAYHVNFYQDAKVVRTGATRRELLDLSTINGKGYSVKLTPADCQGVWGAWDVELTKAGAPTVKTRACDFQSAADDPFGANAVVFSVWF